jgi:hypothetical protein
MEIVVVMVMVKMLMKMPSHKPRRSRDINGFDFPFTGGTGAAGSALSRSRRVLSPLPMSQ